MRETGISIRAMQLGEDGTAFRTLNEEWISRYFVLEPKDIESLGAPEKILRDGGRIYFAHLDGRTVGCVALIALGDGIFELSKMAVTPAMRGRGIGRQILAHAIEEAKAMGVRRLFLGSNSILKNAVHLYESLGFVHIPRESAPWVPYARADVWMELPM